MIRYARLGGLPPADNDTLDVHEPTGEFQAWRSRGAVAGRFRGKLRDRDRAALAALADRALAAGPPEPALVPDAGREVVRIGTVQAKVADGTRPHGPWGELLDLLHRVLVEDAVAAPRAAVALEGSVVTGDVRLAHRGTHPLDLDLDGLAVHAELQGPDPARRDRWAAAEPPPASGRLTATPGWSLPLHLPTGAKPPAGGRLIVQASLVAYNGRSPTPIRLVSVEAAPPR